jgi:hypothetical protein
LLVVLASLKLFPELARIKDIESISASPPE